MTVVWFLSCVDALVYLQITGLTKCFPTLLTVVWFLSRVDDLVSLEFVRSTKCFPTLLTVVWFLSCVNDLVSLEFTRCTKCFPTLLTVVWFLSHVDALVNLQTIRVTKGFTALLTSVASGSFCWNLARALDGSRGGSDRFLIGGCDVWEETRLHLDFSTPQQSAVQVAMAPLHVFVEEDLRRVGVRTLGTGESLCWCQLGFPS